jgi:hypothetical protein
MIQKFFDNFFPRFKIGRIMGFDRGRHWDATLESRAKPIRAAGHRDAGMRMLRRGRRDSHAFETFLLRSDTRGRFF